MLELRFLNKAVQQLRLDLSHMNSASVCSTGLRDDLAQYSRNKRNNGRGDHM